MIVLAKYTYESYGITLLDLKYNMTLDQILELEDELLFTIDMRQAKQKDDKLKKALDAKK